MPATSATLADWRVEFDRGAQVKALVVGAAFVAVFWNLLDFIPPRLGDLVYVWLNESDWSHGPIIPLFSMWLVYVHWQQIRGTPVRHTWVGLLVMLAGLVLYQISLWALLIGYLRHMSMLVCLLGVVIFLCGLPVLRQVWVPWLYLFFAIPLPKSVYFQLTDPLRRLSATVVTAVLGLVPGLDIERRGSTIDYYYRGEYGQLGVVDACAGMRSTMTLCALGVAVTFISDRPWWQRLVMIAACVPIAVFSNFIRVGVTCWLHIFVDPQWARGTPHMVLGLLTLLLALGVFAALGWVLSNLFVEESEPEGQTDG